MLFALTLRGGFGVTLWQLSEATYQRDRAIAAEKDYSIGPDGFEPPTKGLCNTSYGFRRPFRVRGLDCLFTLRVRRTVSTPSSCEAWLGIGIPR